MIAAEMNPLQQLPTDVHRRVLDVFIAMQTPRVLNNVARTAKQFFSRLHCAAELQLRIRVYLLKISGHTG